MRIKICLLSAALGCGSISTSHTPPKPLDFEEAMKEAPRWVTALPRRDDEKELFEAATSSPTGDLQDVLLLCRFDFPETVTVHGRFMEWSGQLDPVVGIEAPDKSYSKYRFGFNQRTVYMAVPLIDLKSGETWKMRILDQGRLAQDNYVASLESTYAGKFPFLFSTQDPNITIECRTMEKSAQDAKADEEAKLIEAKLQKAEGAIKSEPGDKMMRDDLRELQQDIEALAALVSFRDARVKKTVAKFDALLALWDEQLKSKLPDLSAGGALSALPTLNAKLSKVTADGVIKISLENKSADELWFDWETSVGNVSCGGGAKTTEDRKLKANESRVMEFEETSDLCIKSWAKKEARPKLFRLSASKIDSDARSSELYWVP